MPLAWRFIVGGALAGRGKECRNSFCLGGSLLDAPIHEEFVIRDVTEDSTTRLGGRRVRPESIA